jgi:hypothetical protein
VKGYGLANGALLWGFLVGLFHAMGGLPERTSDVVLGAACVGLPWLVVHVARAWAEARLDAAARWYPSTSAAELGWAAARVWVPPALGLAGLMAGAAAALLELPARALGSLLATGPVALGLLVLGAGIGEVLARRGQGARDLERWELLVTCLGLGGITLGLRGRAELLQGFGATLRGLGPPAWVGPASTGRLPPEGWALSVGFLGLFLWGAWRAASHRLQDPGPRPSRREAPVPPLAGRPARVWRTLTAAHLRRWGPMGPLALVVAGVCLAHLAPLMLELGRIPGDGPFEFVEFTFLVQLALGLALVGGVPDWTPPPAPLRDWPGMAPASDEADRAYAIGLWRALIPGAVVVVGLSAGGALDPRGIALILADGWVLATACVGLAVVAVRLPARPGSGAFLYLAGLALIIVPHLVLDLCLAWIQEPGGLRIPGLLWSWITVKALAVVISTSLGAGVPLVYCKAWSAQPNSPTTDPSAPPPLASGGSRADTR